MRRIVVVRSGLGLGGWKLAVAAALVAACALARSAPQPWGAKVRAALAELTSRSTLSASSLAAWARAWRSLGEARARPSRLPWTLLPPVAGALRADGPGGAVIAAAPGAPVRAGAGGVVRYAGPDRGRAKAVVVVVHGASVTYAGLERLRVRVGERVRPGELLGQVAPGPSPAVVVRVLQGGKAVDPLALFPPRLGTGGGP